MKNKNILLRALLTGMLCITSLTMFTGCIGKKDGDGMVNGRTADGELPENGDDEPVPIKANKAGKPEIKDSSTTEEPEQPEEPETTPKPEKKEETEEQKAEKSLEAFRQSMEGTLQNFGVAFLGEVDESYADRIPEWIEENFPDLSEKYPFVKMIPEERIIENEIGQLFCVVPRSGDDPVEIIEQRMNFETFEMDEVGQLYSSETGEPYLVMCNGVGGYATAMISMGTEAGYQADWHPMMDMLGRVAVPVTESGEPQAKDFTDYAACGASRFGGWYGDVSMDLKEKDLADTSWELQIAMGSTDSYGNYFLEFRKGGKLHISWCEREYGVDEEDYDDTETEAYEGTWSCSQEKGRTYLTMEATRTGGEWYQKGEDPVTWSETFCVYSVYSGSGLLLENETENASMPSNQNDTQLLEAIRTYG